MWLRTTCSQFESGQRYHTEVIKAVSEALNLMGGWFDSSPRCVTDNTEKVRHLLDEALQHSVSVSSEVHSGYSVYVPGALEDLSAAMSAITEAVQLAADEIEALNKKLGDLADRLGD